MSNISLSKNYSLWLAALTLSAGASYFCFTSNASKANSAQLEGGSKGGATLDASALAKLEPAAREIAVQVPQALDILNQWREQNPQQGKRFLHVVYWTPRDKPVADGYQERLDTIFDDIEEFYRGQMESLGFGPNKTVGIDRDEAGALKIHFVKGQKDYDQYEVASGADIRRECLNTLREAGVDASDETLVIFCNMSVWDSESRRISQNSPYYALGSNTEGTAWQVDSPILKLEDLTNQGDHVIDGQYGRITLGKYNTIFIGGIVHELGHAFGLPHNKERADQAKEFGVALMGSGNRAYKDELRGDGKGAFITLAHGLKLASHPMFSGYTARMHEDPETQVDDLRFEQAGNGFTVSGKVTGSIPPYAVLAYMNPEGNQDYNATTTSCIPDEKGNFTVLCNALEAGKDASLSLVFLHANGKASSFHHLGENYKYPYSVDANGVADISLTQKTLQLASVAQAIVKGEPNPLSSLAADCSEEIKAHAQRLVDSRDQRRTVASPAALAEGLKEVILTDCQFEKIKVGYGVALFDRSNSDALLLVAGNKIYSSGLFAHAQSHAVYSLGGKWSQLTGVCGVLENAIGKSAFVIKADGKEIFQSSVLSAGQPAALDLDVTGVQELELITTDGGDGIRSDWSAWLDMKLSR